MNLNTGEIAEYYFNGEHKCENNRIYPDLAVFSPNASVVAWSYSYVTGDSGRGEYHFDFFDRKSLRQIASIGHEVDFLRYSGSGTIKFSSDSKKAVLISVNSESAEILDLTSKKVVKLDASEIPGALYRKNVYFTKDQKKLFIAGANSVHAFDVSTGSKLWRYANEGLVWRIDSFQPFSNESKAILKTGGGDAWKYKRGPFFDRETAFFFRKMSKKFQTSPLWLDSQIFPKTRGSCLPQCLLAVSRFNAK